LTNKKRKLGRDRVLLQYYAARVDYSNCLKRVADAQKKSEIAREMVNVKHRDLIDYLEGRFDVNKGK
jgi:hypothetical protein